MHLSVIICTHNPRKDYLTRTLDALKAQTLPKEQWELLLIDNASAEPLAGQRDLSWHPGARHIREETLGLTPARLRGIREAGAELLVFVDDDNVLAPDYLEQAVHIGHQRPYFGMWGGACLPEYETPPPDWAKPYMNYFALFRVPRTVWSNLKSNATRPVGAGMCIRRQIAKEYASVVATDPLRLLLDRKGTQLTGCGDDDMAYVCVNMGFATARCSCLSLKHLIPASRFEINYMARMVEGTAYSSTILAAIHSEPSLEIEKAVPAMRRSLLLRLICRIQARLEAMANGCEKETIRQAGVRGHLKALACLRAMGTESIDKCKL
jgi:hypothetical protein